ncbi:arylsulfatase [Draconibacterium orientale]|uniref:arylsulfatase n=1 Tax=Draconibacterium orientale TaxID=1168034 RepID=UPI002ABD1750|nr:arylsulfatase [Draconibacterium orientale]
MRNRFLLVGILILSLHNWAAFGNTSQKKQQTPNIVLVFVDDLGYGDLGCYGQELIQTPNIDKMAEEGVRFTDFYSAFPVCAPSRCALMTGKHAGNTWIRHNMNVLPMGQMPIPVEEITIPEILKEQGYKTGAFGKWSLGAPGNSGDPLKQGFDYFYGYYCQCYAHNYFPEVLWRNGDTIQLKNETTPVHVSFIDYPLSYATKKEEYSAHLIFDDALDFIERNRNNPFFLYYASALPHSNGEAPLDQKFEIPDWGIYTDSTWTPVEKGYAAMVTLLDKQMGQINSKLKELGLEENTLVIFTSDNGPTKFAQRFESAGELRGRKRDLYEGGIRVPLIAQWPKQIKPGQTVSQPAAMYDLLPTFAALTNAEIPRNCNGEAINTMVHSKKTTQKDYLYWEFYEGDRAPKQAVRKGDWKLLRFNFNEPAKSEVELYNLANDLSEENNLAEKEPAVIKELLKIMDEAHQDYQFIDVDPK